MLTAYDHVMAGLLDQAGVEMILVGDSLGNVVLGHETTLPVTLDDMIRHAGAVYRGTIACAGGLDLPFGTATDPDTALRSAVAVLQQTGCQAVKIEGGAAAAPIIARLVEQGIPVMGHIGLTPQAVHQLGGYYRHGKSAPAAQELIAAAQKLQQAGAFAIVLEFVVPELAAEITRQLDIPDHRHWLGAGLRRPGAGDQRPDRAQCAAGAQLCQAQGGCRRDHPQGGRRIYRGRQGDTKAQKKEPAVG